MKFRSIWALAAVMCSAVVSLGGPPPPHDVVKDPTNAPAAPSADNSPVSPLDFSVKTITGEDKHLSDFKGKVVMIVNVASKCGFTRQYKPLEDLYAKYSDRGLVIVGFPANNFGQQEPGTNDEIDGFCKATYGVKFPMMAKISVKGDDKAPLYNEGSESHGVLASLLQTAKLHGTNAIQFMVKLLTEPTEKAMAALFASGP
jgi:glutathione peroxidase-family protein